MHVFSIIKSLKFLHASEESINFARENNRVPLAPNPTESLYFTHFF